MTVRGTDIARYGAFPSEGRAGAGSVRAPAPGVEPPGVDLFGVAAEASRRGVIRLGAVTWACGLTLCPGLTGVAMATNQATAVRLGRHNRVTRVVVDLAEDPAYRLYTLVDPPRFVIDILDSDGLVPAGALPGATGVVRSVRHGLLDGGVTRMVLDLSGPVAVKEAFELSPRDGHAWRLVIDLTETSARAFRAGAGPAQARVTIPADRPVAAQAGSPGPASSSPPALLPPAAPTSVAGAGTTAAGGPQGPLAPPLPPPLPPVAVARPPVSMASVSAAASALVPRPTGPAGGPAHLHPAVFVPVPARKPPPPHKPLIAIDPGHGGRDPGAISVNGVYEKDITLAMGRELRKVLVGTGRYRVVMTRDRDVSVRLRERVRRARQANADLFLSIHADSINNKGVRGLSVYTLSEKASDAEAGALAERENKADIILGMDFSAESRDVTNILIDLAQRETMNRSVSFANTLLTQLPAEVRTLNHSRRYAGFAVLKAPDVPSVLLEMGYLSNQTDEKLLRQRAYRAKLAQAVVGALDRFFATVQGARRP